MLGRNLKLMDVPESAFGKGGAIAHSTHMYPYKLWFESWERLGRSLSFVGTPPPARQQSLGLQKRGYCETLVSFCPFNYAPAKIPALQILASLSCASSLWPQVLSSWTTFASPVYFQVCKPTWTPQCTSHITDQICVQPILSLKLDDVDWG